MKYIKIIGNIITGIAIALIIYKLLTIDIDVSDYWSEKSVGVLCIALWIYICAVLCAPWPWRKLISITEEKKVNYSSICMYYTKANLMKYLPGNIFQYVGRNEVAQVYHLDHGNVALATILEIVLLIIASIILSIGFCGEYVVSLISFDNIKFLLVAALIVISASCIIILIAYKRGTIAAIKNYITPKAKHLKSLKTARILGVVLLFYICSDLIQAANFCMILSLFFSELCIASYIPLIIGAYVFSWLLGYITPGSPGGLGIREVSMMTILSTTNIGLTEITISLALTRVINIVGDLGAFLLAWIIYKIRSKSGFD